MTHFFVPNRLKVIKKTSSGLIGMFTIKKKIEFYFRALFFIKLLFFAFLSHLETIHFLYQGSINDKPPLQSN